MASGSAVLWTGLVGAIAGGVIAQVGAIILAQNKDASERQKDAINRAFDSAGSHMAVVAFDKYVGFCEAYATTYRECLATIVEHGPCKQAMSLSADLSRLRAKWALWVTPEIDAKLEPFEKALNKMGRDAAIADPQFAASVPNRHEIVDRMYKTFSELFGFPAWNGEALSSELAVTSLMGHLRDTLGIEVFGSLRQSTVRHAFDDYTRIQNQA